MGFRKGTGFTNINRVLQANKGSQLGTVVSGGISGQVQKVTSGVQGAKQAFDTKAEENRLDTDAAKQKRDQTLGKFDSTPVNVDESKFAVSSGLQSDYDKNKADTSAFLDKEKQSLASLTDTKSLEAARDARIAEYNTAYAASRDKRQNRKQIEESIRKYFGNDPMGGINKAYADSVAAQTRANFDKVQQAQGNISSFGRRLQDIETDYSTKSTAEKAAYVDSEQRRIQEGFLPTESELSQFSQFSKGAYAGPTALEDTEALSAQAQQAENLGKLARTQGGGQELLKQFVGGRDYTSGQRKLDETILGQDKGINLGAATRQARGLVKSVDEASRGASAKAQEYTNRAKAFGDETRSLIEGKQTPLLSQLDEKMKGIQTADTERSVKYDKLQSILKGTDYVGVDPARRTTIALEEASGNGLISAEEMTKLSGPGGIVDQAKKLGIDPNALLSNKLQNTASQNVTRSGLATGSENVRLAALNRLLGKQDYENEFAGNDRYQAGQTGLDMAGIEEFIRLSAPGAVAPARPPASQYTPGARYVSGRGWQYTDEMISDENMKEKIDYDPKDVQSFLDRLKPASYDYKDKVKDDPRASKDRQIGVMAQDLEKSKLGKEAVSEGDIGKIVDYKDLEPKMLASLAALNRRLKKIEGK